MSLSTAIDGLRQAMGRHGLCIHLILDVHHACGGETLFDRHRRSSKWLGRYSTRQYAPKHVNIPYLKIIVWLWQLWLELIKTAKHSNKVVPLWGHWCSKPHIVLGGWARICLLTACCLRGVNEPHRQAMMLQCIYIYIWTIYVKKKYMYINWHLDTVRYIYIYISYDYVYIYMYMLLYVKLLLHYLIHPPDPCLSLHSHRIPTPASTLKGHGLSLDGHVFGIAGPEPGDRPVKPRAIGVKQRKSGRVAQRVGSRLVSSDFSSGSSETFMETKHPGAVCSL